MERNELKACVFDLDGVIVDTAKYHFRAWRRLANTLDFDFTETLNEQLKGVSRIDSLNLILEWANIDKTNEEKRHLCDLKNQYYLELIEDLDKSETLPGVEQFLKELTSRGIKIGLGSASKNAVRILDFLELRSYFKTIVDGTRVKKGKPDPETFIIACENLSVNPANTIVFEDAPKGVDAAKAGGMSAVGIGSSEILGHADLVIDGFGSISLNEIMNRLDCFRPIAEN